VLNQSDHRFVPALPHQELKWRRGRWTSRWILLLLLAALATSGGSWLFPSSFAQDAEHPPTTEATDPAHPEGEDNPEHAETAHEEEHGGGGHADPVSPLLASICIILFLAKVGGDLAERIKLPAVLGELLVGVLLGNFMLMTGYDTLEFLKPPPSEMLMSQFPFEESDKVLEVFAHNMEPGATLDMLARVGVILLLFEVGLETSVRQMLSVGKSSLFVAILGVIAPFILGYLAAMFTVPQLSGNVHMFIGATLCATSVGITARVLKDLGKHQDQEGQIILGAAVIDDVLGLVILAVVTGIIEHGSIDPIALTKTIGLTMAFLGGAVLLGTVLITRPLFKLASNLRGHGLLVATSLVICFGFAWLSNQVGLAPIVGAFAAGLILERAHYQELGQKEHYELEEALEPLTALLVPIFFVQMGIQVDLRSFANTEVLTLAAAITVVAIIGKQVCSFGVTEKGLNKAAVGLGMIPRGEVGLIFAAIGRGLKNPSSGEAIIDDGTYSAVVVMVMVTTMITPPLLKWQLMKKSGKPADGAEA